MKRFIYIFSIALLVAACVDPLQPYLGPIENEPEDGAKVTLEFSLPPMTKGTMAHDPTISTIHVAVFNQAGVLKQYEKATLTNPTAVMNGDNPSGNPTYSVEVNMSAKPRILHFIADSPIATQDELIAAAGTSGEDAILSALTTAGKNVAYWQRVVLNKIDAYTYKGGVYDVPGGGSFGTAGGTSYQYAEAGQTITVYEGDYIKRNGHKILDGTGYFQSDYVAGMIGNIAFVRNFAEVSLGSTSSSNFTPKKFALVNVPKAGYVAPYDAVKGEFVSAYTSIPSDGLSHSAVAATQYAGSLAGSIDKSLPTTFQVLGSGYIAKDFMYERTIPNASQPATCIIVGGTFTPEGNVVPPKDSEGNTWFKIELTDGNGAYFPVYRGVSYCMTIGAITGTLGYGSAQDAYDHDPVGDISGSVTTSNLEQISDGKGTTLWVEYVDYVATEAEDKTIYYTMYYTNPTTGAIMYLYDRISITDESVTHPDENYKAITETPTVAEGTFNSGTPDDTKTWKKATVKLAAPGNATKHSILHIEGTSQNNKAMYRDVHYRVMGTQKFEYLNNKLKGASLLDENAGRETTLYIYLPKDLGMSMFPLTLRIEAENEGFTSVDGLPVESGPSLFNTSTSSRNAFYFLKTIEYDDYNAKVSNNQTPVFTAQFKTTRDGRTTATGTNATNFRVLDKVKATRTTPYFEYAECYVSVGGPMFKLYYNGVETNSASVKADVTSVSFDIRSTGDENPTWTLIPSDGITTLTANPAFTEGYSSSGNATITVTIPENTDTENSKTYTVKATRDGFDEQEFKITQNAKVTLVPVTRTISTTSSTFNTSYVYTGEFTSEVGISIINGQSRASSYIDVQNNGGGITLSANTITSIVITWYSESYAANNTTISNGGGGSIDYSTSGSYPTTTWTGSSNSVTLSFARSGYYSRYYGYNEFTIRSISVTYLHEAE